MTFNFQDIFKSNFLENVDTIPFFDMVLALTLSFCARSFLLHSFIRKRMLA